MSLRQRAGRFRVGLRRPGLAVLVLAGLTLAAMVGHGAGEAVPMVAAIERLSLDWRFRLRGVRPASPEVIIVAADEASVASLGRWPPSRSVFADAVGRLAAAGASAIVLDLLLDMAEDGDGASDPDAELAAVMRKVGRVVLPFGFVYRADAANAFEPPEALQAAAYPVVRLGAAALASPPAQPVGLLLPQTRFLAAAHPAHATLHPDAAGAVRALPLAMPFGERWYRAVPVEALRLHLGLPPDALQLDLGRAVRVGGREIATARDMSMTLDFRGPAGTADTVSLLDLLRGEVPRGRIEGRIALIGVTAAGLGDRYATPFDPGLPGVEVLATGVDNLLANRSISTASGWDLLAILVAGLTTGLVALVGRPLLLLSVASILALVWFGLAVAALSIAGVALDLVLPTLLLLSATMVGLAFRRRDPAEAATAGFIALDRGPAGGRRGKGGFEPVPAVVLFVDMAGFTAASERMSGSETVGLLRRLHALVEDRVRGHGGLVVDYVGDGALAVFGLDSGEIRGAAEALACARDLADQLQAWRSETPTGCPPPVSCRVGIHLGPVTAAELGGPATARATIVGDTVNVASRLEALNKEFGSTIAVSDAVVEAVRACGRAALLEGFEPRPPQALRGRDRPLGVWTLD